MSPTSLPSSSTLSSRTRKPARQDSVRLTRDDWLDAAHEAVAEGGFEQVRVLTLAHRLGVTRGSFYWHFDDHAALIAALLERWREHELRIDAQCRADITDDPQADLLRLLDFALSRGGAANNREMRFGLALRALGRSDPAVARLIIEIDEARRDLFVGKFLRLLGDPAQARERAIVFYLAIAGGIQALARTPNRSRGAQDIRQAIASQLLQPVPRKS